MKAIMTPGERADFKRCRRAWDFGSRSRRNLEPIEESDSIDGDRAILMSDTRPTSFFSAQLATVSLGDTVAIFGAAPVGRFAIASAFRWAQDA